LAITNPPCSAVSLRQQSYLSRLPSNLRLTHECVHLVTRAHFRSRDKWRTYHSIRHSRKPHATRKRQGSVL